MTQRPPFPRDAGVLAADAGLVRALHRHLGRALWTTSVIVLLAAIAEGVGLVALAPLLAVATGAGENRWWRTIEAVLARMGVDTADGRLVVIVVAFALLLLARGLLLRWRDLRLAAHNLDFADQLRIQVIGALARAPWQRLPAARRSDIEHAMHADIRRVQNGSLQALRGGASLVLALAQAIAALVLSWQLALVALGALVLVAAPLVPRIVASRRLGQEATQHGREAHEVLARLLTGLKLFKAHGREAAFVADYDDRLATMRGRALAFATAQADVAFLTQLGAGLVLAVVTLAGVLWLGLPVALIGLFVVIFARLAQQAFALIRGAQAYAHMLPAFESLRALKAGMPQPLTTTSGDPREGGGVGAMRVSLAGIFYAAGPGQPPILRGIDLDLAAGEVVALVGPSGGGKTTLVDIAIGMLAPDRGTVAIDGHMIGGDLPPRLRDAIAYVPQEAIFFDGDVRRNMRALAPDADDATIGAALRLVEADTISAIAAHGLDARLGDLGQRFSGGERQRLALARALLRQPRLLVLDEAMSALDRALEARIFARLASNLAGRATILLVTHRLPEAAGIERVMQLDDGRLRDVTRDYLSDRGAG
ncbi:ATP-binding cassette domain-containing protein [Sphingomonas baiyangensis]|uniref:ATP-binding cassette domain-containing protein n=1 Tax=Sphingomonas baiyangensis TaxID=2572576 RepID=A0A4U1L6G0_9SPHN|nr:ATP-binding cassette domain-containing protein [Sphingomonas baiyangensis]TKD51865.1 ATP-binding cassette domain-containing protein [Sphingomonas baiyangensis]